MTSLTPISFKQFINEARKNPGLNPKTPINQLLQDEKDKAKKLKGTKELNLFVSFTQIDKLGINPSSKYNTPLGIYSYPIEYVLNEIGDSFATTALPFAGDSPFVNVFSVKGNILNLNKISNQELENLYNKMANVLARGKGAKPGSTEWKYHVDEFEKMVETAPSHAKFNTNGGRFWYISMIVSRTLTKDSPKWRTSDKSVSWNKLFREIGIDGCVDFDGEGIIHTAEPTQAVFFSRNAIEKNHRYDNKYAPEDVEDEIYYGQKTAALKYKLKNLGPYELAKVLETNPNYIQHIKNPSIELQKIVINAGSYLFKYIKNPSIEVQKLAVTNEPDSIQYIENPSIEIQRLAVTKSPDVLEYIKNPPEEIKKLVASLLKSQ